MTIEELKALQEKHRNQIKHNREKTLERKHRTHRLIVRGAIAEKIVPNSDKITDEEFQNYLFNLVHRD